MAAAPVQVAINEADVKGRFNFLPATKKSSALFNFLDEYTPIKINNIRYPPNKMVKLFMVPTILVSQY
jgi:hypothetical protein